EALGGFPEKTPLKAKVTGTVDNGEVTIEKLHFQSRPGLYVTGNLYRPKNPEGKYPAVLYVCGHSSGGRDGNKTKFQDHGTWFASNGFVCLIIDTLQLGEIPGIHHGTYREGRWWWQTRGYTPAGVECWNGIRAIDYLAERPDVDVDRIAVTGISGGGAATIWIAAADDRVKVAVPVSGMSDLQDYVAKKIVNGHCDCMFLVNGHRWDWTTIAALIAPRPLLFANSDKDTIFPMDGNRRIIEKLRRVYKLYNQPDAVDEYVSKGGHEYRPDLRVAVFQFINGYLRGDTRNVKDSAEFKPLPGKDLRAFSEDKDIPTDTINGKVDETFVPLGKVALPTPSNYNKWKSTLLHDLRSQALRAIPDQVPVAKRPETPKDAKPSRTVTSKVITENDTIEIALRPLATARVAQTTIVVLNPGEAWEERDKPPEWVRSHATGNAQALLPRGVATEWTHKSPPNYVERAHALLGRSVDEGRLWDVLAIVRMLNAEAKERRTFRLVGRGPAGIICAYAALFDPAIREVVAIDPPASHRNGPYFLNVMRVLDIPDALGMLAPMPLTLVNAKDKAFDRTAEIYRIAGAENRLQRK
ncbi:MAG TPA: prolyl oligopeptidase family serine peptidase, partial [Gemmataceae bacterium]|nr:prolyl oligopeptidase family serine peptidase [Gemmataceae bacterium]